MPTIDLTGKMKQVPGVATPALLVIEAADALDLLLKAYAQANPGLQLGIKHAYVDPYKLITEIADKRDPNGPNAIANSATTKILDTLKSNGQPTIDELNAALTELNQGANDNNGQGIWNYAAFTEQTSMYRGPATKLHPTIVEGTYVFGWPNIPDCDPRRTGKCVVFSIQSPTEADWLMQNSYKYGFIYYTGPCDTFMYVGSSNVKQDGWLAQVCGWGSRAVLAKRCKNMNYTINDADNTVNEASLKKAQEDFYTLDSQIWSTLEYETAKVRNSSNYMWQWTIDDKVNKTPPGGLLNATITL